MNLEFCVLKFTYNLHILGVGFYNTVPNTITTTLLCVSNQAWR